MYSFIKGSWSTTTFTLKDCTFDLTGSPNDGSTDLYVVGKQDALARHLGAQRFDDGAFPFDEISHVVRFRDWLAPLKAADSSSEQVYHAACGHGRLFAISPRTRGGIRRVAGRDTSRRRARERGTLRERGGQEPGRNRACDAVEASQPAPRPASKPDIPRAPFPSWGP